MELNKTALLILHWQNDVAHADGKLTNPEARMFANDGAIINASKALEASRKAGVLVVYVNGLHRPGYPELPPKAAPISLMLKEKAAFLKDSWGAEVITLLEPKEDEFTTHNSSTSAFIYTELDLFLRNNGIEEVVLTGLSTDWMIESTARDAFNRGYFVTTLSDCCDSPNPAGHEFCLNNTLPMMGSVIDSDTYIKLLTS